MSLRSVSAVCMLLLGIVGGVRASEEEFLLWSDVRIACVEREDTGKVVFSAKVAADQYQAITLEAFGKSYPVAKADLPKLKDFPLSNLVMTHEAGYERLGGHTVHFKLKRLTHDAAGALVEERLVLSISRGNGLALSEREQRRLKTGQ